jgi:ethanolamine utilization protein EutQ
MESMSRPLFTAADIRRLVHEQKATMLVLGADDLVTPEAADLARELGLQLIRETRTAPRAASTPGPSLPTALPPLKVVRGAGVALEPFGEGPTAPGTNGAQTRLRDVVTSGDGAPMAAGYMELDRGEFPWTLTYDEVDIVLDGELVITRGGEQVRGGPGDVIFIPKGSRITFGTPSHVRFVYVAYPANWNAQG